MKASKYVLPSLILSMMKCIAFVRLIQFTANFVSDKFRQSGMNMSGRNAERLSHKEFI